MKKVILGIVLVVAIAINLYAQDTVTCIKEYRAIVPTKPKSKKILKIVYPKNYHIVFGKRDDFVYDAITHGIATKSTLRPIFQSWGIKHRIDSVFSKLESTEENGVYCLQYFSENVKQGRWNVDFMLMSISLMNILLGIFLLIIISRDVKMIWVLLTALIALCCAVMGEFGIDKLILVGIPILTIAIFGKIIVRMFSCCFENDEEKTLMLWIGIPMLIGEGILGVNIKNYIIIVLVIVNIILLAHFIIKKCLSKQQKDLLGN